jgi:iron complex transport system substrate-binding protein
MMINRMLEILCISIFFSLIGISIASYEPAIYGDANQDNQLDQKDVDYVAGIISGTKEGTKLSDANYDGKVDASDILQIERIIRGNQTNLTLLDMDGRSVTIPQPSNRVLAIGFGFIENAMLALGVENEAVGTGGANSPTARYLNPELSKLPDVGTIAKGINYETVAAVNPDLVIIRKNVYFQEGGDKTVDMIEKLDIPVIVLRDPNHFHTSDINTIYQEIGLLGRIFTKTESAKELINEMDERVTSITERTKNIKRDDRPKALFCALANSNTREKKGGVVVVWAKECASTFADLLNIKSAYEGTGRNYLSAEQVLNLNPDVIIVETGGMLNLSQLYDDNDEYFKNIREVKAIQERRISSIGNLTYYGDIQLELPVMLMIEAKSVYPEKFSDINVSEWIDRYYEEIYKIDEDDVNDLKKSQGLEWIASSGF